MLSARRCDTGEAPREGHFYIIKKCLALIQKVPWPVLPGYVNNNNGTREEAEEETQEEDQPKELSVLAKPL